MQDTFEEEVKKLWDESRGNIFVKLERVRNGLKIWAKHIRDDRRGLKEALTVKLESFMEANHDEDTLIELIDTKL